MKTEYHFADQSIGVIGHGKFGKLLSEQMLSSNKVNIYDISKDEVSTTDLEGLMKESSIVIPSVPINQFESTIKQISPYSNSNQVIIDACSVKEYPVDVMLSNLPEEVSLIATHPMFGPKTFDEHGSLRGLRMVMCNVRCENKVYQEIKNHFESLGLVIIEMTPQEHDRLTAQSQFFAQCMRYTAQQLNLKPTAIDTVSASEIFSALSLMGNDQKILEDILKYNRFARQILNGMVDALKDL